MRGCPSFHLLLTPGLWLLLEGVAVLPPPGGKTSVASCPASGPSLASLPGAALSLPHADGPHLSCAFLPSAPPCGRLAQLWSFLAGIWTLRRPGCCFQTTVQEPVSGGTEEGAGWRQTKPPCAVAPSGPLCPPDLSWTMSVSPCTFVCTVPASWANHLWVPENPAGTCPLGVFPLSPHPCRSPQHLLDGTLLQALGLSEASVSSPSDGTWPRRR